LRDPPSHPNNGQGSWRSAQGLVVPEEQRRDHLGNHGPFYQPTKSINKAKLQKAALLSYFVNEDKRVLCLGFLQTLNDFTRHCSDVSAPVSLNLSHIGHATNTEPEIL
jgi:hypothetical protein